jgi:primosomal protein N'
MPGLRRVFVHEARFRDRAHRRRTQRLFPEARLLKLDSDSSKVRQTIAKTLERFARHEPMF